MSQARRSLLAHAAQDRTHARTYYEIIVAVIELKSLVYAVPQALQFAEHHVLYVGRATPHVPRRIFHIHYIVSKVG